MKCLRCGHCCINYDVEIVDNKHDGLNENNVTYKPGGVKCKHLRGEHPGAYSCELHDMEWYKLTPCYDFGQIESSPDSECRMGRFILDGKQRTMR